MDLSMNFVKVELIIRSALFLITPYFWQRATTQPPAPPEQATDKNRPEIWLSFYVRYWDFQQYWNYATTIAEIWLTYLATNNTARFNDTCPAASSEQFLAPSLLLYISFALMTLGITLRLVAFRTLKNLFTFNIKVREGHKLVTTGLYNWIQHPAYAGTILVTVSLPFTYYRPGGAMDCLLGSAPETIRLVLRWALAVLTLSLVGSRIKAEEAVLAQRFPEDWPEYNRTRKRLIPGIL